MSTKENTLSELVAYLNQAADLTEQQKDKYIKTLRNLYFEKSNIYGFSHSFKEEAGLFMIRKEQVYEVLKEECDYMTFYEIIAKLTKKELIPARVLQRCLAILLQEDKIIRDIISNKRYYRVNEN